MQNRDRLPAAMADLSGDIRTLFAEVDARYLPTLHHLDVVHPRLMILFSGPPSSGKSTVAKAIAKEFQGVRLENDAIRTLLLTLAPNKDLSERRALAYQYRDYVMSTLVNQTQNGLWIIDSSIDRSYDTLYDFTARHSFTRFLISMNIPENVHYRWIIQGGDRAFGALSDYLEHRAQRRQEQQAFLNKHQPDLVLGPDYEITAVFNRIRSKLAHL